jgi:pimeloyl-ACP methyl ester carboxylesterase
VTCPSLIVVGDRDEFCTPEEAVQGYHTVSNCQLAILPATGHIITRAKIDAYLAFAG